MTCSCSHSTEQSLPSNILNPPFTKNNIFKQRTRRWPRYLVTSIVQARVIQRRVTLCMRSIIFNQVDKISPVVNQVSNKIWLSFYSQVTTYLEPFIATICWISCERWQQTRQHLLDPLNAYFNLIMLPIRFQIVANNLRVILNFPRCILCRICNM